MKSFEGVSQFVNWSQATIFIMTKEMENDESHWDNKVYFSSKNVTQRKLITFRTPLKKKWDGELVNVGK